MTHGGEYMKQNEKCQSLAGYLSGHSERDKDSPFPRGFVVSKMKKSEPTGVFLPLTRNEISRLEKVTSRRGESVKDWLLLAVLGALECDEEEADFEARKDGEAIVVKIPKKTAARLERAAEFEEMSVAEYVKDGIRRDLDLTSELMASKN